MNEQNRNVNRRIVLAKRLLYTVFVSSLFSYVGIITGNTGLKIISAAAQVLVCWISVDVLMRYRHHIDWRKAFFPLVVVCLYPLARILADIAGQFSFKTFTDGFFVQGGYYQLLLAGFAMAVLTADGLETKLMYEFALRVLPVGLILAAFSLRGSSEFSIGLGHLAINNCFIPAALFAIMPIKKKWIILGWIGIALILPLSAKIFSRSYTLVGAYFALFGVIAFFSKGRHKYGYTVLFLTPVVYFSGVLDVFKQKSVVDSSSVADKYQFGSLWKTIQAFFKDGNFIKLFNWEGNSRSGIIVDAFGRFTNGQWLWGKGVFGQYDSFYKRSTIEIGWAQELFRWGISYVVILLILILYARRKLRKDSAFRSYPFSNALAVLLLIRFLDGMVFGLPVCSIYSLLMFWGIMRITIVKRKENIIWTSEKINKMEYSGAAPS